MVVNEAASILSMSATLLHSGKLKKISKISIKIKFLTSLPLYIKHLGSHLNLNCFLLFKSHTKHAGNRTSTARLVMPTRIKTMLIILTLTNLSALNIIQINCQNNVVFFPQLILTK